MYIGAGTRYRIQASLSGMNIYHARTSKLVSDFLSLERSLVTNSAHAPTIESIQKLQAGGYATQKANENRSRTAFHSRITKDGATVSQTHENLAVNQIGNDKESSSHVYLKMANDVVKYGSSSSLMTA